MGIPAYILERIEQKKSDYQRYDFSQIEKNALATFFDLAQEFSDIEDMYALCVAIPQSFFGLDARLYLVDSRTNTLSFFASSEPEEHQLPAPAPDYVRSSPSAYNTDYKTVVFTIRGKKPLIDQLPFETEDDVLGFLEILAPGAVDAHKQLFFEKYANRIGFRLHNKLLMEKLVEHLKFIRSLVADIEHNVIVPNMIYKLFLRRLNGKVKKSREIESTLADKVSMGDFDPSDMKRLLGEISEVNQGLTGELENLESHYKNMSLFIETLFRKSHFDQGRLILRTKSCNMKKDIVQPQLERYMEQFRELGISVDDRLSVLPDEETINVVDEGLIAQVYANLFSNALKYTQEVVIFGEKKKYIAYGQDCIKDFFGPGKDGAKYNVFSTGPHIPAEEREKLFEEEFRASNAANKPGTGHGLAFIKNVIELHGGVVGYEPTDYGNNFYFVLPQ